MGEAWFRRPLRPLGQPAMARVDRAARGSQGSPRGRQSTLPAQNGSPFPRDHPRLVRCNDFKDATKAAPPSSTDSTGVAIPNAKTLTENDAVALELVREHPWLTEIGSRQRPRQPVFGGSQLRSRVSGSDGRFGRALASAVPRIVARRLAQCTRGASRAPTGAVGSSVDGHTG
jgi:hypothetical protein